VIGRYVAALTAVIVVATPEAGAQTSRADPTDLQGWIGASLRLDLPKRWAASLQYRLRMVDDIGTYRGSYFTPEVARGFGSHFKVMAGYRLALVDEGRFHRLAVGAEVDGKVGKVGAGFRSMLQYQRQNFAGNDEQSSDDDALLRTRFEAKLPVAKGVVLHGSSEPFFKFEGGYLVDNWRNTLGVKLEYAKNQKVDVFYIYRPDYAKSYNRAFHVIGLELEFEVKPLKGKKRKEAR